jgi:hypothetical protein
MAPRPTPHTLSSDEREVIATFVSVQNNRR